jgi:hypothetical protein
MKEIKALNAEMKELEIPGARWTWRAKIGWGWGGRRCL